MNTTFLSALLKMYSRVKLNSLLLRFNTTKILEINNDYTKLFTHIGDFFFLTQIKKRILICTGFIYG